MQTNELITDIRARHTKGGIYWLSDPEMYSCNNEDCNDEGFEWPCLTIQLCDAYELCMNTHNLWAHSTEMVEIQRTTIKDLERQLEQRERELAMRLRGVGHK